MYEFILQEIVDQFLPEGFSVIMTLNRLIALNLTLEKQHVLIIGEFKYTEDERVLIFV